ncbi:class I SAM-dependent methyltransferase, partial [Lachnospiraceae bacterium]|nr:class I SAM-dependent methyltransferase [Lachnospiraceae bacterium]
GGGCIVYTDFGNDIQELLEGYGFSCTIVIGHKFYEPEEITDVDATYGEYLDKKACAEKYFKYNSIVISAVKAGISDCNPYFGQQKEKSFFYLHRYVALCEMVKGKDVIEVEYKQGSGRGCHVLAGYAKTVRRISFEQADLPLQNSDVDVVICFDTVEYLEMERQRILLEEIQRVLKPDGILVIVTPNKMENMDRLGLKSECPGGGFYQDEFVDFVSREFRHVCLYKQFLEVASFLEKFDTVSNSLNLFEDREQYNPKPKYMMAVATNGKLPELKLSSVYMNESEEYYFMQNSINNRKFQAKQKDNVIMLQEEELGRRAVELDHRMDKINELGRLLQEAENVIKLQGEELERRAVELDHRMDKINELDRLVQEAENILRLQTKQMEESEKLEIKVRNEKGIIGRLNKKFMIGRGERDV